MARLRSIKPEFWSDLSLARLTRDARLLYIALWNQADEHGRLHGDPRWIKGHCLPYDDDLNLAAIIRLLDELERAGKVQRYEAGEPYVYLPKLANHQRLETKVPSRLPVPPPVHAGQPEPDPPEKALNPDEPAPHADDPASTSGESAPRANKSASRADSPEQIVALHVAGGMEQGAVRAQARGKPPRTRADPTDHDRALGAWIEAATARQGDRPAKSLVDQVARQVKTLLGEGKDPRRLEEAARAMGTGGWTDLGRELLRQGAGAPEVLESVGRWDV